MSTELVAVQWSALSAPVIRKFAASDFRLSHLPDAQRQMPESALAIRFAGYTVRLGQKYFSSQIDGRFDAEAVEIGREPLVGAVATHLTKMHQEIPIAVQPARPRTTS